MRHMRSDSRGSDQTVVFYTAATRRCNGKLTPSRAHLELRVDRGGLGEGYYFFTPDRIEEFAFPYNGKRAVFQSMRVMDNDQLTREPLCEIFALIAPQNEYRVATEEEIRMFHLLGLLVEIQAQRRDLHREDEWAQMRLRQLEERCQAEYGLEPFDLDVWSRLSGDVALHRHMDVSWVQSIYETTLAVKA